jgi:hypothetical protein
LITPPNFSGGGGNCLPSSDIVDDGDPGVPFTCWAPVAHGRSAMATPMPAARAQHPH